MLKNVIVVFILLFFALSVIGQTYVVYKVTSLGMLPQATVKDLQVLCDRIRILEFYSPDFKASKVSPLSCDYYHDAP